MRIIKWDKMDETQYPKMCDIENIQMAKDLIIKELREKGYHFSGEYHQNGEYGAPVFDNGEQYHTTLREWGAIMAEAYPDEVDNSNQEGYRVWAWKNLYAHMQTPAKYPIS